MIETITETGSTSADLAARLRGGTFVGDGDWLVADRQTAGRGRMGRIWADGEGNFMGSTVVRLASGDPPAPSLALVAGLALHETLASATPPPRRAELKWPNDVMVDGAKLAGILLEREGDAVIVGIGVNLRHAPGLADRQAIALADLAAPPARDHFAANLAQGFAREVERWRTFGLAPIIARWQAAAHPQGTGLTVTDASGEPVSGAFAGLTGDGALQLRLADGTLRAIHAGEVRYAHELGD